MRSTLVTMVAVIVLVGAVPAVARTVNTGISINATQISEDDSGPCSMPGFLYDDLCPTGACICRKFSGTIRGGLIGKGPVNISVTIDTGAITSTPGCTPFFGAGVGTTPRASVSVNVTGDDLFIDAAQPEKPGLRGGWAHTLRAERMGHPERHLRRGPGSRASKASVEGASHLLITKTARFPGSDYRRGGEPRIHPPPFRAHRSRDPDHARLASIKASG